MSLYKGSTLIAGRKPQQTGAMTYKGSCLQSALPTSGMIKGDYYLLTDASGVYMGKCAIWNGSSWDYSSASFQIDSSLSTTSTNAVENKVITNALNSLKYIPQTTTVEKVWSGTLAEYDDIETKDPKTLYNITDDNQLLFDCLPKSGGTMTGDIVFSGTHTIKSSSNNSMLALAGGKDWYEGSGLVLNGLDSSDGSFILYSATKEGATPKIKALLGKSDGTLNWDDDAVLTSAGGTITGSFTLDAEASKAVAIKQNVDTSKIGLVGGSTDWQHGAGLDLYGKDYSESAVKGQFDLFANDGVNTVKKLSGKPNGQLLWNSMRVPTIVSSYINATTDINGNLNITSYRPAGTSFPIGFLAVGMSETVRYCFMTGGYYMTFGNSGATWEAWANATITGTIFWIVL